MSNHPIGEHLIAFAEGGLERLQRRAVVAHLLRGCPACGEAIQQTLRKGQNLAVPAYDAAFAGALLPTGGQTPEVASCRTASRRPCRHGRWQSGSLLLQPVPDGTN